jgi:7-cyano-7-deazaguanine synthase
MTMNSKKAVIILSGGLDSTTCMGIAAEQGYSLYPLTFDYGQRHRIELINARKVADYYGVGERMKLITLPFLRDFGGSALTDDQIAVPRMEALKVDISNKSTSNHDENADIPVTYVPGRNLLFLSIATSYAEAIGAEAIYIGVNALDYSGYPDCRPDFIAKVNEVIALATKVGVQGGTMRIHTPLIDMTKADIVREGLRLDVPYVLTTSCYNGGEQACGECDSCILRLRGFAEAGSVDPITYS